MHGCNLRWGAVVIERLELPRAVLTVSRRKARRALAVRLGVLGKGGGLGSPQAVSVRGEALSRRSDNTSESFDTIGVSGVCLVIFALGKSRVDGKISVSTLGSKAGTRPVSGLGVRETVSEREAFEEESLDILRKVKQITETWNHRREEIT